MADRKNFLVDPQVQRALGRRILIHWMSLIGCLLCANLFFSFIASLGGDADLRSVVLASLRSQITVVGVMLLLLPIFHRDTLRLSNRFAGPMSRLRTGVKALAQGQRVRPLKFRSGDFWQDMAGEFNRLAARMDELEARNRHLEQEIRRQTAAAEQPVSC